MYSLRRARGPFSSHRRDIPCFPRRPLPRPLLFPNSLPSASLLSGLQPRVVEDEEENDGELTFSSAGRPTFSSAGKPTFSSAGEPPFSSAGKPPFSSAGKPPFSTAVVVGGPTDFVFLDGLLKAKHSLSSLRRAHARLAVGGLLRHPHLGAQLITGYADLGDLRAARSIFDEIHGSGSFLWNNMARVLARGGHFPATLELYSSMRQAGVPANNYTYPFILKACASTAAVTTGRSIHGEMEKTGFATDAYAAAALLDMYAKCGEIADGRNVFEAMLIRDLVSWTAMITACEQSEEPEAALLLFRRMQEDDGLAVDRVAAISVASAIAQLGDAAPAARTLHGHALRRGFLEDVSMGNAVLGMHAKCGDLELARRLFDGMAERDDISWNSMLSGYAQNGRAGEAMALFDEMLAAGEEPNPVSLLVAASACAQLGSLRLTRRLHRVVLLLLGDGGGVEASAELQSAIMDMYAKCGDLESAAGIFHRCLAAGRGGHVNCWNVMISGYGLHGHGEEALRLFRRMTGEGLSPDHITLTSLLSACSHAGLVEEGKQIFQEMSEKLAMAPMVKHYACVVDMLGRAGRLEEARDLIAGMPAPPNDAVWGALLGACRIHGNRELAEFAAGNLLHLEPDHSGYYVLMSNVYAASTLWPEAGKLRDLMRCRGLKKPAAFSVIEIGGEVHGFYTADQGHPERAAIYRKAAALAAEMSAAGHQPDTSCVLHDVEEEDKETLLALHSEKLAVAYGLMRLGAAAAVAVIRVTVNLRICRDCHSTFKALSMAKGRTIVVRDANRFHHFAGGACSCKDYW
ncbi:unnamed protein product [Spirodela intermedia]|uniref:DYW domain-containing protein n=1 Tax=Spirodela intermedia TaxID=51605 RepID=A0A7I8L6Q7_SPIIN|nr:unnamed protein product [Spirodela intermedia]